MIKLRTLIKENIYNLGPLYHGTNSDFKSFDNSKIGTSTRTLVHGFFFTDDKKLASKFGNRVITVMVSLKNPMVIDADGRNVVAVLGAYEEGLAKDNGHDGIIVKNVIDALGYVVNISGWSSAKLSNLYIVFDEKQIKII